MATFASREDFLKRPHAEIVDAITGKTVLHFSDKHKGKITPLTEITENGIKNITYNGLHNMPETISDNELIE